jgi:hypothetical protein
VPGRVVGEVAQHLGELVGVAAHPHRFDVDAPHQVGVLTGQAGPLGADEVVAPAEPGRQVCPWPAAWRRPAERYLKGPGPLRTRSESRTLSVRSAIPSTGPGNRPAARRESAPS